ncbi:uncharacterized protein LOC142222046 [Haematobia irritans]|uniref:uncharacterized protein LOC142222046 n=1 Tax=Haematobia irritans TaxID=7368 RepID=UPI003F4F6AB7
MERFAIKIDRKLKANLYKICRLCGMDYPDMIPILTEDRDEPSIDVETEPEMSQKINVLIGLLITKDDRMPQTMCSLCVDKINDFYEFREMCYATNAQTRKLLGLKNVVKKPVVEPKPKTEIKEEVPAVPPAVPNKLLNRKRKADVVAEETPAVAPKKETIAPPVMSNKKLRLAGLSLKEASSKKTKFKGREAIKEPKEEEKEVPVKDEGREVLTRKMKSLKEKEAKNAAAVKDEEKDAAVKEENKETSSKKDGKDKLAKKDGKDLTSKKESKEVAALKKEIKDLPPRRECKEVLPKKDSKEKDGKDGKDVKDMSSKDDRKKVTFKPDVKEISSKKDPKEGLMKKGKHKHKETNKDNTNNEPAVKDEIKEELKEEPPPAVPPTLPPSATAPSISTKLKQGCSICTERFATKGKLEAHVRLHHIPKVERYVCSACNETISKSFEIKNHQLWHKLSKTPYVCGLCGESIISTYAYARHLQSHNIETPPALMVLDRECPQCHVQYETNFLYNTHPCAVKTRRCAGCNRSQRSESEYIKHSAICAKVYLNYSKHVAPAVEAQEDAVRIKNENDVEAAAAAEEMARITGLPLEMSPVVHLTRLSSPLIMAANQCVSIPGLEDSPTTTGKKSGKKGVSKKELKRVDELLKSTLDALVSIKHEPEVHVEPETEAAECEGSDNETGDHGFQDDYHHNEDSDEEIPNEEEANKDGANNKHDTVKIKQEIDENMDTSQSAVANETPTKTLGFGLKLKIRKEHGQLNSSIIEQQAIDKKAEKRKKKKKHKDKEKDKQSKAHKELHEEPNSRDSFNTTQVPETAPSITEQSSISTVAIHIKTEPVENMETDESVANSAQIRPLPEATIMTSIPMMQLQISCISEGVDFNGANTSSEIAMDEQANCITNSHAMADNHHEDIKPNREELDRMMKITNISSGVDAAMKISNVSSGIDMETDEAEMGTPMEYEDDETSPSTKENEQNQPSEKKSKQIKPKPIQKIVLKTPQTVKSRNKACKSTAKPSGIRTSPTTGTQPVLQISSVQSGVTLPLPPEPVQSDFIPMFIKPEPQNRGYSDETPTPTQPLASPTPTSSTHSHSASPSPSHSHSRSPYPSPSSSPSPSPTPTEPEGTTSSQHLTAEEQAYISTIDFNNITIKQEKDLDIDDTQISPKKIRSRKHSVNGVKKRKVLVAHKKDDDDDEQEEAVEEDEDDEIDAEDDEAEEEVEEEEEDEECEEEEEDDNEDEEEIREYRELEYPPEMEGIQETEKEDGEAEVSDESEMETNDGGDNDNDNNVPGAEESKSPITPHETNSSENDNTISDNGEPPNDPNDEEKIVESPQASLKMPNLVIASVCSSGILPIREEIKTESEKSDVMVESKMDEMEQNESAILQHSPLEGLKDVNDELKVSSSASLTSTESERINSMAKELPQHSSFENLQTPVLQIASVKSAFELDNTASADIELSKDEVEKLAELTAENEQLNREIKINDAIMSTTENRLADKSGIIEYPSTQTNMEDQQSSSLAEQQQNTNPVHSFSAEADIANIEKQVAAENAEQRGETNDDAIGESFEPSAYNAADQTNNSSIASTVHDRSSEPFANPVDMERESNESSYAGHNKTTGQFNLHSTPMDTSDQSNTDVITMVPLNQHSQQIACSIATNNSESESECKENASDHEMATTLSGVIKQMPDMDTEAQPVLKPHHNSLAEQATPTVGNANEEYEENGEEDDEMEDADGDGDDANDDGRQDFDESEENSNFNLEERQNHQNQEQQVNTQLTTRPTALALHPYLEDISSSSNSFLSNTLSQTPPPPPGNSNNNCPNQEQLSSHRTQQNEETENILNESHDILSQHHRGEPSTSNTVTGPASLPFNFDNINEIAENNNNANIEREQLQEDQERHIFRPQQQPSPDDVT